MNIFFEGFNIIHDFLALGGWVLYAIAALLFMMWLMIIERIIYLKSRHIQRTRQAFEEWENRVERQSWQAHRIREELVSRVAIELTHSLPMIQACVALCPLLGLLGTVTGMIDIFQVMAINGTSNVRAMAAGVSKATIPTMAGMVAALSGLFFSFWLRNQAERERALLNEHLTLDH